MELFVIPAFLIFAMICIGMQERSRNRPKKIIQPSPAPSKSRIEVMAEKNMETEEPIEKVIQRIKDRKRQDRQASQENWDAQYYSCLPVTEHPDYFEPKRSDNKEGFVSKTADGMTVAESSWFINSRGKSYTIHPDHMNRVIGISCSGLYWHVPMDKYSFLLDK